MPLFVGQLNNAENTVKDANIRAVRGTAVAAILSDADKFMKVNGDGKDAKSWTVTATVSATGDIEVTKIVAHTQSVNDAQKDTCEKNSKTKGYTVTVYLDSDDFSGISNGVKE